MKEESDSPYCYTCGACGEDGCCPPTKCVQEDGKYCAQYLKILKATYIAHTKIYEKLSIELQEEALDIYIKELEKQ